MVSGSSSGLSHVHICQIRCEISVVISLRDQTEDRHRLTQDTGDKLAMVASTYAEAESLGYYPPVPFMKQNKIIDSDMAKTFDELCWQTATRVRTLVGDSLSEIFSSIEISQIQISALNMPKVRYQASHALQELAQHFTPDTARISCIFSVIQKNPQAEGMGLYARKMLWKWLSEKVSGLEIHDARVVS